MLDEACNRAAATARSDRRHFERSVRTRWVLAQPVRVPDFYSLAALAPLLAAIYHPRVPESLPSSADLHPKNGARFTFERASDGCYSLMIHLPEGLCVRGSLDWGADGAAVLQLPEQSHWTAVEAAKLARVITRTRPQRLMRWRPSP